MEQNNKKNSICEEELKDVFGGSPRDYCEIVKRCKEHGITPPPVEAYMQFLKNGV